MGGELELVSARWFFGSGVKVFAALIGIVAQTLLPKIGGGRCAAYEILVVTSGIANLIRENKTFRISSAIQTGAKFGMQLMDDALFKLWFEEKVALEEVLSKAHNPDDLAKRVLNAQRGIMDDPNAKANGEDINAAPKRGGGH